MTDTTLKCHGLKAGKYNKPLLERQRRARINRSLEEIKELILSSLYKDDPTTFAKKNNERMDKAEILEFAVDYIKHQKLTQYDARPAIPPTNPERVLIQPRLHYLPAPPPQAPMPYTERLAIGHQHQAQPWMGLVRCAGPCCVQYYGNISPIPSPTLSKTRGGATENVNEQTKVNGTLEHTQSVWRPW